MKDDATKILDEEILDTLHDAIGDSLSSIIKLYLTDVPSMIAEMQQALASKDFVTLTRLAHSLKSSSANLGAMQTSALAVELEHTIAIEVEDVDVLNNAINQIAASFDQTRIMFDKYT